MKVLKSIYNFLCGDPYLLLFTPIAFLSSGLLLAGFHASNRLVLPIFIGFLLAGLLLSLNKERNQRHR